MTHTALLADRVLREPTPAKLADATERIAGEPMSEIETSLPGALAGERERVREYVYAYKELAGAVLDEIGLARPDMILVDEAHRSVALVEVKSTAGNRPKTASGPRSAHTDWVTAALTQEAMSAPFSEWVEALGAGRGTAVAMIEHLRKGVPGGQSLRAPRELRLPDWALDERRVLGFHRAVLEELTRARSPLEQIAAVLGLSQTELARLFGVRRQAIEQWQSRGVPSDRQEKLATLGAIADLLAAKLKRERIPGVVRRKADAYGGRSILQAIAAGDEQLVFEELRSAFDWAATA